MIVIADTTPLISYEEMLQVIEILRNAGRHIKDDLYMALLKEAEKYRK